MFCKLKETHRKACDDFCDLAGKNDNYVQATILAIILDFVLPIISVIFGVGFVVFTLITFIFTLGLGIFVLPIIAVIFSIIGLAITVLLVLLLGRQIGLFVATAVIAELVVIGLTAIPEIGLIFAPLGLVPWYLISVIEHALVYKGLCRE